MWIYILLLAGSVILGVLICRNKIGNMIYCILAGIALFVIAALRRSVGHDYNNYAWGYWGYMSESLETIAQARTEKGYSMLNKLLADYIPEYQSIFIIVAAFFAICTAIAVYKYCKRPYIAITFFLVFGAYFNTLNFLRQFIAAYIMFYAYRFIKKNQFFRFLILVLFATCFHRSALIMIPLFFIMRVKVSPVSAGVIAGLTVIYLIFSWNIMEMLTQFLYAYRGYTLATSGHFALGCNPTYAICVTVFFIPVWLVRKRLIAEDPDNNLLINCYIFLLVFELIGVKHSIISRLAAYFILPVSLILMPRVVETIIEWCKHKFRKDRNKVTAWTAIIVSAFSIACIGMYGALLARNYNGILPYRTMFDDFSTEGTE